MQLIKPGESVVAIVAHHGETWYLKAPQRSMEWVPLFLAGRTTTFVKIDPLSLQGRFWVGQERCNHREVVCHAR